jgi:hypothetical protein
MIGNIGIPFLYEWAGNPTGVSTNSLNPPQGALIIDNTTGTWFRKTSVLGDNSGFVVVNWVEAQLILTDTSTGQLYAISVTGGEIRYSPVTAQPAFPAGIEVSSQLTDSATGINYGLFVQNGQLTLGTLPTQTTPPPYFTDTATGQGYQLVMTAGEPRLVPAVV